MVSSGVFVNTEMEAMVLKMKLLVAAKQQLPGMKHYSVQQVSEMSEMELVMRWILHVARRVNYQIQAASSLEPSQAIPALVEIQNRNEQIKRDLGAPGTPFIESPAGVYLSLAKFDRFIKLLQTVEAIRHEIAINGGKIPESLDAITGLPIPSDPLTGKAFVYEINDGKMTLRTPLIVGIEASLQKIVSKNYTIEIAE